jgi:hypothetical protein
VIGHELAAPEIPLDPVLDESHRQFVKPSPPTESLDASMPT